ncbi:hypothetical protein GCM10020219_050830 [Nonomuraea dietziae]
MRGGQRVFLDAEHFFDGYKSNPAYALEVLLTAAEAGADVIALCDTNGGMLPDELAEVVHAAVQTSARVGIHCHDDTGCAVANTLAAVKAGATHVQGCANGYGERSGNANLFTVVANLQLKRGFDLVPPQALADMTRIAHAITEVTNVTPNSHAPYVGTSAFAHKAGPCTPAPSRWTRTSTSTSTPPWSATTCACWSRTWQVARRSSSRAASSATS